MRVETDVIPNDEFCRQTMIFVDRQKQTDRQTDRQTDKKSRDRQTDRPYLVNSVQELEEDRTKV